MDYFKELIEWIKENKPSKDIIAKKKVELCKKFKRKTVPTDIEIYLNANQKDSIIIRPYLQTKPVRTGSGVAIIATMAEPYNCPHGSCTFCPGGLGSFFGDVPKSYTGNEPSTMRGMRNDYDPYRIIFNRLEQYIVLGQNPQKVDQIIMGGTFPGYPKKYQHDYIYFSFKAMNDFSKLFYHNGILNINTFKEFFELPGPVGDKKRSALVKAKVLALRNNNIKTLSDEQKENETAEIRCIGLTIETKPDYGFATHGLDMLKLGVTRIELGIQTVYDDILKKVNRGHTLDDTKKSIAQLRDLGFKLNFHMMPGLPEPDGQRITKEKDLASLKEIFDNPHYRPDMLKVYPCMVMPGTALEKSYDDGIFKPLSTQEAADIIVEMKRFVPKYCRIMRIQRDIPTKVTLAGVGRTNLRQYVEILANKKNIKCRCIRCREIRNDILTGLPEIKVYAFDASGGEEFFISAEINDRLLGFVRLRFPSQSLHPVITNKTAIIRELHVYGQALGLGMLDSQKSQHKGIGKKLMQKAEDIANEHGKNKIAVISGVGVRGYYQKLGYELDMTYMVKKW